MPSLGLRISWVFELQPGGCVVLVDAEFSLRHNPLKVTGANFREKALSVLLEGHRRELLPQGKDGDPLQYLESDLSGLYQA